MTDPTLERRGPMFVCERSRRRPRCHTVYWLQRPQCGWIVEEPPQTEEQGQVALDLSPTHTAQACQNRLNRSPGNRPQGNEE